MARDDYAYLQTDTDRYFSTVSLAQLEKRLDGHGFFRVHRGYLVNLSMVEEIESVSGGTLLLTLNAVDEKIPVSRRRVSALKKGAGAVRRVRHNEPRKGRRIVGPFLFGTSAIRKAAFPSCVSA